MGDKKNITNSSTSLLSSEELKRLLNVFKVQASSQIIELNLSDWFIPFYPGWKPE